MRNRIKLVLDTNIFLAGWFEGDENCEKILELVRDRKITLLFSQETIGEFIYVLKNFTRYNIDDVEVRIQLLEYIAKLFYYSLSINTMNFEIEKSEDPYDDMLLKCALKGEADYLVTDDFKHGLHARDYDSLIICSSIDFINKYYNEE